jgi:hypothetical protein
MEREGMGQALMGPRGQGKKRLQGPDRGMSKWAMAGIRQAGCLSFCECLPYITGMILAVIGVPPWSNEARSRWWGLISEHTGGKGRDG